ESQAFVKDKRTALKVVVRKRGDGSAKGVTARVAYNSNFYTDFCVGEGDNIDQTTHTLKKNYAGYPLNFASSETTKTIYFFSDNFAPANVTFQASAEIDYLKAIPEIDETNSTTPSGLILVGDTAWSGTAYSQLYIHYFRTDWGRTPLAVFTGYYQYSNEFVKGVFPVSEQNFTPGKSDFWFRNTETSRGSDGKLDTNELGNWVKDTFIIARIDHPAADRSIAIVPIGWFFNNIKE
ncbi:MAG: hypothetical protein M1482_06165, partial [Chloroflexi bacterium]|nr:hypothetical protein [Chloroflexota bacterium]